MSSSMPIPNRQAAGDAVSTTSSASSSYSSPISSSHSPSSSSSKGKASVFPSKRNSSERISPRRPSLLGNSLARSEHTVINLGHADGPPRLVTCVKSSQGFDWNQELFLPSYARQEGSDLEHKQEPVEDIILTDEEAASMLPQ